MTETMRDVREHFAAVVDRADRDAEPTIITRHGREVAAIVPISVLRDYERYEEEVINKLIDERMKTPAAGVPLADVMAETLARDE